MEALTKHLALGRAREQLGVFGRHDVDCRHAGRPKRSPSSSTLSPGQNKVKTATPRQQNQDEAKPRFYTPTRSSPLQNEGYETRAYRPRHHDHLIQQTNTSTKPGNNHPPSRLSPKTLSRPPPPPPAPHSPDLAEGVCALMQVWVENKSRRGPGSARPDPESRSQGPAPANSFLWPPPSRDRERRADARSIGFWILFGMQVGLEGGWFGVPVWCFLGPRGRELESAAGMLSAGWDGGGYSDWLGLRVCFQRTWIVHDDAVDFQTR